MALIPITHLVNGKEIDVGNTGSWDGTQHRRVACLPGTNTFFIKNSSLVKRVDVVVSNNMVTPVVLTFNRLSRNYLPSQPGYGFQETIRSSDLIRYDATLTIQSPLPVSDYDKLLSDSTQQKVNDDLFYPAPFARQCSFMADSVDLAPLNSQKGYVHVFYNSKGKLKEINSGIQYFDPTGDVAVRWGRKNGFFNPIKYWDNRATHLFICPVGTNSFLFYDDVIQGHVRWQKKLQVVVKEGMVTPVIISFDAQSVSSPNCCLSCFGTMPVDSGTFLIKDLEIISLDPQIPDKTLLEFIGEEKH